MLDYAVQKTWAQSTYVQVYILGARALEVVTLELVEVRVA